MQRVRIGLTGLAFVFLLVLLGAVFRSASDEAPITVNSIENPQAAGEADNNQDGDSTEPLAELGVAPGNADSNAVSSSGKSRN